MYLLYLDDSGSAKNKNEQYLVLGGVSVFERKVYWLAERLNEITASIYPADPGAVEFHASEIFSGRRPPWSALDKSARRDVIRRVLGALRDGGEGVSAFACAVHKASVPSRDPMEVAFEDLCSRFDMQLKRIYHTRRDPQRGLIILDKSAYETALQQMAMTFRALGTRWGTIHNMTDVPLFVESKASRIVQLADHVAYAVFRRYEAGDTSYLDIILPRFDAEQGTMHGLAHKFTGPDCMCPACMSRR